MTHKQAKTDDVGRGERERGRGRVGRRRNLTIQSFNQWNDSSMELKFRKEMSHYNKSIINLTGTAGRLQIHMNIHR